VIHPPSIGVQLPTVDGFRTGNLDIRPVARRAEELGFDSVWVGDHLAFDTPILESVVAAATVAAVTERVAIGLGVMQAALRHPAWIAKQLGALQAVSGNRIEFGVGVGGNFAAEWDAVGVPVGERAVRTDAILHALPSLLAGDVTTLPAPWSTIVPPLAPSAPVPPLWVGGRAEATLERAVRHGAGWLSLWSDPPALRSAGETMAGIAAASGKPPPPVGAMVLVNPAADTTRGEAEMATFMEEVYGIPFARIRRWALTGGEEALVAGLRPLIEAGASTIVLIPAVRDTLAALPTLSRVAGELRRSAAASIAADRHDVAAGSPGAGASASR
jgi:alkanesulfonate monooxygenase SsuD/methylene tetrahydromethanopterin reductase-like flavin-dependent oxidoreductase (luciferase family)